MAEEKIRKTKPCEICGGSGQTGCFRGESRFMISWEDCLDCHGTGVVIDEEDKGYETTTEDKEK